MPLKQRRITRMQIAHTVVAQEKLFIPRIARELISEAIDASKYMIIQRKGGLCDNENKSDA